MLLVESRNVNTRSSYQSSNSRHEITTWHSCGTIFTPNIVVPNQPIFLILGMKLRWFVESDTMGRRVKEGLEGGGERLHLVMVSCFKVGALSFMVDIGWNQGAEFKQFNTIGPVHLGGEILTTRIECLVWRAVAPSGHRVGSTLAGPFLSRALFWLLQFWCNKVYSAISCRLVPIQVK